VSGRHDRPRTPEGLRVRTMVAGAVIVAVYVVLAGALRAGGGRLPRVDGF